MVRPFIRLRRHKRISHLTSPTSNSLRRRQPLRGYVDREVMIDRFKSEREKYSVWRERWNSLPILRKEVYLVLSVIFGTVNFCLAVNDFIQFGELRNPMKSTYKLTTEILVSSTFGFYFGLIGFVYCCIRKSEWRFLGIFAIVWNVIAFMLRMISELVYIQYRPESFGDD